MRGGELEAEGWRQWWGGKGADMRRQRRQGQGLRGRDEEGGRDGDSVIMSERKEQEEELETDITDVTDIPEVSDVSGPSDVGDVDGQDIRAEGDAELEAKTNSVVDENSIENKNPEEHMLI